MKTEYSNNFPPNETREMSKLWDVDVDKIIRVMLSDNKWYIVKSEAGKNMGERIEFSGYVGNKPYYFKLVTSHEFTMHHKDEGEINCTGIRKISGLVNQIKLIEEEVS